LKAECHYVLQQTSRNVYRVNNIHAKSCFFLLMPLSLTTVLYWDLNRRLEQNRTLSVRELKKSIMRSQFIPRSTLSSAHVFRFILARELEDSENLVILSGLRSEELFYKPYDQVTRCRFVLNSCVILCVGEVWLTARESLSERAAEVWPLVVKVSSARRSVEWGPCR